MTERLYESDAYCRRFNAIVNECRFSNGKYYVVLDRTAFFPEGGGQAADNGTINGLLVVDVQQQDGEILHVLESELKVGEEVDCEIDWETRYRRMQGHTGEHILSGVVKSLYGYDNVGFHMSENTMLVDFNGSLSAEDIKEIEICANKAVYMNADIVAYRPNVCELEKIQYRCKKEITEDLRIVSIGKDIDCCACCAPHLARTGEVGLIKVIDFYSYKKGTRIEMVAGINAIIDYIHLNSTNKELMKVLSAPRDGVVEAVYEKVNSYQVLRNEYQKQRRCLALCELELIEIGNSVYSIADDLTFDELRYCANQLINGKYNTCLLLSKNGEEGYLYVASSMCEDVRIIAKQLNDTFSGKGGGQRTYSQGKIEFFSESSIRSLIEDVLKREV